MEFTPFREGRKTVTAEIEELSRPGPASQTAYLETWCRANSEANSRTGNPLQRTGCYGQLSGVTQSRLAPMGFVFEGRG